MQEGARHAKVRSESVRGSLGIRIRGPFVTFSESFGVRFGSVRAPFGVVRGPFVIRSGSMRVFGVRSGPVQDPNVFRQKTAAAQKEAQPGRGLPPQRPTQVRFSVLWFLIFNWRAKPII